MCVISRSVKGVMSEVNYVWSGSPVHTSMNQIPFAQKFGLKSQTLQILNPAPAMKTGQAPSRQSRATPSIWNILVIYLVPISGVDDPSFTSEGSAMSVPPVGSTVGSGVIYGSPRIGRDKKGKVSIVFYTLHKYETSITREWLLAWRQARTCWLSHEIYYLLQSARPESVHENKLFKLMPISDHVSSAHVRIVPTTVYFQFHSTLYWGL